MAENNDARALPGNDAQPQPGYAGVVLLGWMEREPSVQFLMEDCIFEEPLTVPRAENLWREWRERAASIPVREASAPEPLPLTDLEREHAQQFLAYLDGVGVANVKVIKIDPMQLVVMQHSMNVEVAAGYADRCTNGADCWMAQTLPLSSSNPDVNIRFTRRNLDTDIDIDLPHAEFIFGLHPQAGFGPKELMGHVAVLRAGNRMALGKGYHRLYGKVMSAGGALPERLALAGLDSSSLTAPAVQENGDVSGAKHPGLDIFGARPPLFADFFTEGLAMPVMLKRKRYQLQVRSRWVAMDVP
jgi:hypothetical protein